MVSIRILSDLHLDHVRDVRAELHAIERMCAAHPCDIAVVAGDVTTHRKEYLLGELGHALRPHHTLLYFVLGNHEHYTGPRIASLADLADSTSLYTRAAVLSGFEMLDDTWEEVESGLHIFGSTLWGTPSPEGWRRMNDRHFVDREVVHSAHERTRGLLHAGLARLPPNAARIVVSHHLPSHRLIDPQFARHTALNSCFASACDDLAREVDAWIFGHTHRRTLLFDPPTAFLCNPRGYPDEHRGAPPTDLVFTVQPWTRAGVRVA